MARIRKAVTAGLVAGAGGAFSVLAKSGWHFDETTITQALGAFVAFGVAAFYATWRVPNTPPA